ncbi:MAG: DUF5591 domain-containing protein [Candidatus Thorarchaeota archaeon]
MVRFMIGKGHDGPARRGKIQFESDAIETPILLGPSQSVYAQMKYCDIQTNQGLNREFLLCSTGTILKEESLTGFSSFEKSLYLLPSLLGIASLPSSTAVNMIKSQFASLSDSKLDPSAAVVRIPSSLSLDDLPEIIQESRKAGVSIVSFTFNGQLGPADMNNLLIRAQLPRNWICIALGRIPPSIIPLLYYLGFDIIDMGLAFEAASVSERLWGLDSETMNPKGNPRFCQCVHCQDLQKDSSAGHVLDVLRNHNAGIYKQILSSSIHSASLGRLRWLVESMTHASPESASFLRRVDTMLYSFIEEFTPTHADTKVPFIGPESYYAPVVSRYRENVEKRYFPDPEKRIVLLLPCSARKPYSDSKSHRKFSDVLERTLGNKRDIIAETIITSPLGIVPRDLERIYPPGYYDIPVTGQWDFEETSIAADALVSYLSKFDETVVVIAHVSGGYLDVVRMAEDRIRQSLIYTTHDAPATSRESLAALGDTLSDLSDRFAPPAKRTALESTLRSTADFMFGKGAGQLLVPANAKVGGKVYGSIICRVDKEQTCLYSGTNGSISLTLEGGKRIASLNRYWVRFEGAQIDGSSIFAIGVKSADPAIRPGDEVTILSNEGVVIGVGRSEMSGNEMCDFTNGLAVKVRHKERS